jgi:hypothetical protein
LPWRLKSNRLVKHENSIFVLRGKDDLKMAPKKGGGTRARSAKTGKFVKKSYAKKHKSTTVVERTKKARPKK